MTTSWPTCGPRSRSVSTSRGRSATRVVTVPGSTLEDHPAILEGADIIRGGGLVAFPTETVYGLGADATSALAVDGIFTAKGRPADNPVIVHLAELDDLEGIGRLEKASGDGRAIRRLLECCWPGPLTVVIPALEPVRGAVCRGLDTVAVRMPAHPVALALIRAAGRPIAAPSANLSGRPSPTTAEHVREDLGGRIPLILDGGPCAVGIESTVLDLSGVGAAILRPGAIGVDQIAAELGVEVQPAGEHPARSPGTRYRHYQPRAPVVSIGLDVPAESLAGLLDNLRDRLRHQPPIGYIATRRPLMAVERNNASKVVKRNNALDRSAGLRVLDRTGPGSLTQSFYSDVRYLDRRGSPLILVEMVAADEPIMDRLSRASSCILVRRDFEDLELANRLLSLIPG